MANAPRGGVGTRSPGARDGDVRGRAEADSRPGAREPEQRGGGVGENAPDSLQAYREKRDFGATPEPSGEAAGEVGDRFVVQKHAARRLHYDLRLELDGVLKSWAVPEGPSLVPGVKRLAVHTEDHPLEYLSFEGVIPKGEYGGGTMIVWDRGRWVPEGDPRAAYAKGRITFALDGERLHGRWHLVRTRQKPGQKREQWLLFKAGDDFARAPGD